MNDQPAPDPTMTRIIEAVQLGQTGAPAQARELREHLAQLPDDPYGETIRAAVRDFVADDPTDRRRR
ncbi:hypothetical protein [Micromonospora sp. NPDC005197]|uniref:hypothetical protein n=1 Tax=Micromonospora sp. NPDC005197 TaxID=3157020 RepID=UPI0033A04776